MRRARLLHLGFAFPPGLSELHPTLNPAGHWFEVQLLAEMRKHFEVRTVGVLPVQVPAQWPKADADSGVRHELCLEDRAPNLFHRYRSLARLKRDYRAWMASDWRPDAVIAYNLSPIYNNFLRAIGGASAPRRILLLLDSSQLGKRLPWNKRLRYRLKPLAIPDEDMLDCFDAGIGLSRDAERYFASRAIPFLWMPGACQPSRAPEDIATLPRKAFPSEPTRFGYFGALAAHAGIVEFAKTFLSVPAQSTLDVCGYGKLSDDLAALARTQPRLRFRGALPTRDDCLRLGGACDVLVNPRPASHGNENNFPSKLFEYALCGRAILSTRLSGVDAVLGNAAYYFDARDFEGSLREQLIQLHGASREELCARGCAIQRRVFAEFNWPKQGLRISQFIHTVIAPGSVISAAP